MGLGSQYDWKVRNAIIYCFHTFHALSYNHVCSILFSPKFTVISRADPLSPIYSKIREVFNPTDNSAAPQAGDNLFTSLMKMNSAKSQTNKSKNPIPSCSQLSSTTDLNLTSLMSSLQTMANKYSAYITQDIFIEIDVKEINLTQYFKVEYHSGKQILIIFVFF